MSALDEINRLKRLVESQAAGAHPSARAATLADLALQYAHAEMPLDGLAAVRACLALAHAHSLHASRAAALAAATLCHRVRGDALMAIACGIDAYDSYTKVPDYVGMGHVLTSLAAVCRDLQIFDLAEEVLRSCLGIADRTHDRFLEARTRNALGLTLGDQRRFDEGETELNAARQCLHDANRPQHLTAITSNLAALNRVRGLAYSEAGDEVAAKAARRRTIGYSQDALNDAMDNGSQLDIADATVVLAQDFFDLGVLESARPHVQNARELAYAQRHTRQIVNTEMLLGRIESATGQLERAEQRLRIAAETARQSELRVMHRAAQIHLAACYRKMNRVREAEAYETAAEDARVALDSANREAEREVRGLWATYFSQHPLLGAVK